VIRAEDTVELMAGLYGVVHRALLAAYRAHVEHTNPLVDHPTRRILRFNLLEEEETTSWYERAAEAVTYGDLAAQEHARAWRAHLERCLGAAGGIAGTEPTAAPPATLRAVQPFVPNTTPRRDARFRNVHEFEFPPQTVYNMPRVSAEERNLALLCRRTLEMDVPEAMASFLTERRDRPWPFYREYGRQLWDEARHALMGTVALTARGVEWTQVPLHVGFSLRLNRHADPLERQIVLYAIEQSLMPADTGKRFEYETAVEAGDLLSAHFHDYDWADEVLHAQIGRRWLNHEGIPVRDAIRRGAEIHERTWRELERYRTRGEVDPWDWWRDFVRRVLGRESAATRPAEGPPTIVTQGG
jgi:hypothetical protein